MTTRSKATLAARPLDRNVRGLVRTSITLDADDAAFLHAVIRDTGDGGPLWCKPTFGEKDFVGDKHRAAWLRLYKMIGRACDMHGMTSNAELCGAEPTGEASERTPGYASAANKGD